MSGFNFVIYTHRQIVYTNLVKMGNGYSSHEWRTDMKYPDKIPVLSMTRTSEEKKLYGIQKICKYDDADEVIYENYVGIFDSPDGDIDDTMKKIYNREKEFCENNKYVKPFKFILRKVAITCQLKEICKIEDHFGDNSYEVMHCAECGSSIMYGDNFITDANTDAVYCCADCFMESHGVKVHESDDSDYESRFKRVKHES